MVSVSAEHRCFERWDSSPSAGIQLVLSLKEAERLFTDTVVGRRALQERSSTTWKAVIQTEAVLHALAAALQHGVSTRVFGSSFRRCMQRPHCRAQPKAASSKEHTTASDSTVASSKTRRRSTLACQRKRRPKARTSALNWYKSTSPLLRMLEAWLLGSCHKEASLSYHSRRKRYYLYLQHARIYDNLTKLPQQELRFSSPAVRLAMAESCSCLVGPCRVDVPPSGRAPGRHDGTAECSRSTPLRKDANGFLEGWLGKVRMSSLISVEVQLQQFFGSHLHSKPCLHRLR